MRVSFINFLLNFIKCWFIPFPFYERYCRVRFSRELRSLEKRRPLGQRLSLLYSGKKGVGRHIIIKFFFQFIYFLAGLPFRAVLLSFFTFQFVLHLLVAVPRSFISVFVYVYNVTTFSFFFLTSQLFALLDALQLLTKILLEPFFSYLKLGYYRLLSFMVRNNLVVTLYFAHSTLFWLTSFIAIASVLSLIFYRSDIFMGFSHYDLGLGKLDLITHGLVGHWYKSNWWYFRIWILYAILYFMFPGLRDPIKENFSFIVFFPIFLYFYDGRGLSFGRHTGSRELDNFNSFYSLQLLLTFGSVLSNYVFSQYGESPNSGHPGDLYRTGLSREPLSRDQLVERIRGSRYEVFPSHSRRNVEVYDMRGRKGLFYRLDFLHKLSRRPDSLRAYYGYRQGQVAYLMDHTELDFRAADFVDPVLVKDMYFDEKYYNRMIEDIDNGVFLNKLYIDYGPISRYEGDSLAAALYRYNNMGSLANEPRYYKSV